MEPRTLTLGHSPDPDDAFMFYALARDKIDTKGWRFKHVLQDIQTLNERAVHGELDITAISIHQYPYVADKYALTSCGSSMGDGYGPMVVTREPMHVDDLLGKTFAIPGERTTAFLALNLLLGTPQQALSEPQASACPTDPVSSHTPPQANGDVERNGQLGRTTCPFVYRVVMFDEILSYVADGQADAGLIIHEGQLTYADHKLHLVVDLGAWWKELTDLPLPLGGNCIRRDLGAAAMHEVTGILKESIEYSLAHRDEAVDYALGFARDMGRDLADRFVGMYVNDWTIDYGPVGRRAIQSLLDRAYKAGLVPPVDTIDYCE